MTASANFFIPVGIGGGGGEGAGHRPASAPAGQGTFGETLRRVAQADVSAAAALVAQDPAGEAQRPRETDDRAAEEPEARDGGRTGEREAVSADGVVAAPLTIDRLNALLLVGRGGGRAGDAARRELRSVAPKEGPGPDGAGSAGEGSGRAAESGGVKDPAAGVGHDAAPKGQGREEVGAGTRASTGAEVKTAGGREAGDGQRGGDAASQDGRGREGAARHAAAAGGRGGNVDPLRILAARGLGTQAGGVKGGERGAGAPGPTVLTVRTVAGAGRGGIVGRAAKMEMGQPASGAARRAALAAQMTRILSAAAARGGGTMTMRLTPEHLGAVTVRVGVDGGAVSARFEATNAAARDLLDSTMAALRSSLEAKGLSVERLQVELAPQAESADRAAEDRDAGGGWSESLSSGEQGSGGGAGGGSADGRAGESGARERVRDEGAERPVAGAPDDRTEAAIGAGHQDEVMYLGLDAVA